MNPRKPRAPLPAGAFSARPVESRSSPSRTIDDARTQRRPTATDERGPRRLACASPRASRADTLARRHPLAAAERCDALLRSNRAHRAGAESTGPTAGPSLKTIGGAGLPAPRSREAAPAPRLQGSRAHAAAPALSIGGASSRRARGAADIAQPPTECEPGPGDDGKPLARAARQHGTSRSWRISTLWCARGRAGSRRSHRTSAPSARPSRNDDGARRRTRPGALALVHPTDRCDESDAHSRASCGCFLGSRRLRRRPPLHRRNDDTALDGLSLRAFDLEKRYQDDSQEAYG